MRQEKAEVLAEEEGVKISRSNPQHARQGSFAVQGCYVNIGAAHNQHVDSLYGRGPGL
jgi:hypothetical protein